MPDAVRRILGIDPGIRPGFEALGDVLHPDDAAMVLDSLTGSIRNGRDHNVEYRVVRPGEPDRWVSCRGSPVYDDHGRVMRLSGGTDRVSQTFPPITEPRPITTLPRIVAPE